MGWHHRRERGASSYEREAGPLSLERHRDDWDELASTDPLWAILSSPDKRGGRWDVADFFATGDPEMERVMSRVAGLGLPHGRQAALDFGCGVGRVTRAMTTWFSHCVGLDVSSVMIDGAKRLNEGMPGLTFVHNERTDLGIFADQSFDLVFSYVVLQHLPGTAQVDGYLREFVRVLRPGGLLVFQLPSEISLRHRLQPRRRAHTFLRRVGIPRRVLRERLGLHPIRMLSVPEHLVRSTIESAGAEVVDVETTRDGGATSAMYWATVRAG
jgi:ubiquinone/menaquinone biosynthesis C-methylase UbiE